MSDDNPYVPHWWEKLKPRWWGSVKWDALLAISNVFLASATSLLVVGGYYAYKTAEHAIHNEATNNYVTLWNSDYMLHQRRILARSLLPIFNQKAVESFDKKFGGLAAPSWWSCRYKDNLAREDLQNLYAGDAVFDPLPDSKAASAFESVRTFFEQLGAAYKERDLAHHEAFETFSLPAEAYWTAGVSGWLDQWLEKGKDSTVGTEFRYFECAAERDEKARIAGSELLLVLDQDANLPDRFERPQRASDDGESETTTFGPRIPTDYFVTKGTGESDEGIPPDPYETFSYDIALRQAGIEDFNVVPYTSVLPPEARPLQIDDLKSSFHHGAVLETIIAKEGGTRNQTVCAGIGRVWASEPNGKYVGGYAAEYEYTHHSPVRVAVGEQAAREQLTRSLDHELSIRGLRQSGGDKQFTVACLPIHKKYGMALAAIGFVKFIYPAETKVDPH